MVDTAGKDMGKFESDMRECQQYASQATGAGTSAAVGAAIGAGLMALLAGVGGGKKRYDMGATARQGAVVGAVAGGAHGEDDQHNIIRRCMAGRGYNVLN